MPYSYTQIAQYLRCPRSYRHRYLDGWREKETRAAMVFGRCFEKALESYSAVTTVEGHFIANGALSEILRLNSKGERPGTGWSTRVCISSSALPKTIVFTYLSLNRTFNSR